MNFLLVESHGNLGSINDDSIEEIYYTKYEINNNIKEKEDVAFPIFYIIYI